MGNNINGVRERLERACIDEHGITWMTAKVGGDDLRTLLDHHAELQKHGEEYRQKIRDLYRDKYSREEELASVQAHISALPVLIDAVRRLPDADQVLAAWDRARAVQS